MHRLPEKIAQQIEPEPNTGCWLWSGTTLRGYGRIKRDYKPIRVHRYVYELLVGPIPDGLTIDHLCRMKCCVNPDHLEPVTPAENTRRAHPRRERCRMGHLLTGDGVRIRPGGKRRCRTCEREYSKSRREHVTRMALLRRRARREALRASEAA